VRRFLPELIDLIWRREIDPGKVFDLELPLQEAAEGYRAMDQRQAIKVLLRPGPHHAHRSPPRDEERSSG
jgi:threonine dehydrogenase-like Zn-dependent dehydrogenase